MLSLIYIYGPILRLCEMLFSIGHNKEKYELHNPYEKILLRQFVNNLIVLAYHMYKEEAEE